MPVFFVLVEIIPQDPKLSIYRILDVVSSDLSHYESVVRSFNAHQYDTHGNNVRVMIFSRDSELPGRRVNVTS